VSPCYRSRIERPKEKLNLYSEQVSKETDHRQDHKAAMQVVQMFVRRGSEIPTEVKQALQKTTVRRCFDIVSKTGDDPSAQTRALQTVFNDLHNSELSWIWKTAMHELRWKVDCLTGHSDLPGQWFASPEDSESEGPLTSFTGSGPQGSGSFATHSADPV
jgi:hypothetical protein